MYAILSSGALTACSSGTGGSDVDSHSGVAPTARVQILNGGATATFREGAEILVTGKASEDGDGPIIGWDWRQTAGPAVRLIEANSASVSFTAPHVDALEVLSFALTVEDSSGETDTDFANINVVPARDTNKFLSLDVRAGLTFDHFKVIAALAGGAQTGAVPKPFTLSVLAYLVYPPRTAPEMDCIIDPDEFVGGVPSMTLSGCFVELLEDLTPASLQDDATAISVEWPANVDAPIESVRARMARWWNPRFALPIPRLDAREFNQQFVEMDERDRILEPHAAHNARVVLTLELLASDNQGDATLIVTDLTNAPVALPNPFAASGGPATVTVAENAGAGLPTTAVLPLDTLLATIQGRESALTAAVYYRTVDPRHSRETLNAWLEQAGFALDGSGTLRPEAVARNDEFAHAVYVNNFDLGFGRRMHSRVDEYGNVFSFVKNYTTLEGAIRSLDSFATVVMEYSPLLGHADSTPKFVKFFTYVEDGSGDEPRVASFDFDGRGERYTPGNCIACHGGAKPPGLSELIFDPGCGNQADPICYEWPAVNRNRESVANGNLDAIFLPWDLDSLLFADTDPAITAAPVPFDGETLSLELRNKYGNYSRIVQEPEIKKLNQATYSTYEDTSRTAAVRALLEHWYGGVDQDGRLMGDFDDSTAAPGWLADELVPDPEEDGISIPNPSEAEVIYHSVYAQHCRSCHTALLDEALQFETYQKLIVNAPLDSVFRVGTMPAARLTMDRFWASFYGGPAPGSVLAEHAEQLGQEPVTAPGGPEAVIVGLDPPSSRNDTVYLDGAVGSAFADTYEWTLVKPQASAATLVGATTQFPMFSVDVPGSYTVSLKINAGTSSETTVTESVDVANGEPTASNDLYDLMLVDSTLLQESVLAGVNQDFDPDGDELTVALATNGGTVSGNLTLNADGTFAYTYTGDVLNPPDLDSFRYAVSDPFGGLSEGLATVLLNPAAELDRPTAPQLISATDASTSVGAGSTFAIDLTWLASDDVTAVLGYNVYRNGELLELVPGTAAVGTPVTYTDNAVQPNGSYSYRISALNAANESGLSNAVGSSVTSSLRLGIQTGWGDGTESLWGDSGCIGCHRGRAGGLTLAGNADEVVAELFEDAARGGPRRIETNASLESLLLCKPLISTDPDGCSHGGGDFYVKSDPRFQTLRRWIEDNAPDN